MAVTGVALQGQEPAEGGFGGADLPKTAQNLPPDEQEVLAALERAGITLFAEADKLRARPASALTEGLRAGIAAHRPALLARARQGRGTQNPQNPQKGHRGPECDEQSGPRNAQNAQNTWSADALWVKERMKAIYGLIKEAYRAGYLGPAQQLGADLVQAVEEVAKADGDVARSCRLLSRDGAGNDVAAAALLAAYEQLCRWLAEAGGDPFRRRAAVALLLARASKEPESEQGSARASASRKGRTVGLSEDDRRLLGRYHAFLRERGLTVCERVSDQDGGVRHRILRLGRGTELIGEFDGWLEGQGRAAKEREEET